MKNWTVSYVAQDSVYMDVMAETPEEALEKAANEPEPDAEWAYDEAASAFEVRYDLGGVVIDPEIGETVLSTVGRNDS